MIQLFYYKHQLFRVAVNFAVGFLAAIIMISIPLLPERVSSNVDGLLDLFDANQHIIIQSIEDRYAIVAGNDLVISLSVNNTTQTPIDLAASYSVTGGFDNDPREEVRAIYNTHKKPQEQPIGSFVYSSIVAFTDTQTQEWQPGEYQIKLHYTYKYRRTERRFDTFFTVAVLADSQSPSLPQGVN